MSDLCPFAHQLCRDRSACTTTPRQVMEWMQEAKRTIYVDHAKLAKVDAGDRPHALELMQGRVDRERIDLVAAYSTICPQMLPWPTEEQLLEAAQAHPPGTPL